MRDDVLCHPVEVKSFFIIFLVVSALNVRSVGVLFIFMNYCIPRYQMMNYEHMLF